MQFSMLKLCLFCGLVWGCETIKSSEDSEEDEATELYSGEELVEKYHSALCDIYSDLDCAIELGSCGTSVVSFSDWAQCMNAQTQTVGHCGNIPVIFSDIHDTVMGCVEMLEGAECTEEDLCLGSDGIVRYESCGEVAEAIVQNCDSN